MAIRAIPALIFLSLAASPLAFACEFHGSSFGPYGSYYKPYYGDTEQNALDADQLSEWASNQLQTDAQKTENELFSRRPAARPSFSNAANRAALAAKERIAQNDVNVPAGKSPSETKQTSLLNSDG